MSRTLEEILNTVVITVRTIDRSIDISFNGTDRNELNDTVLDAMVNKIHEHLSNASDIINNCQGECFPPNPLVIGSMVMYRLQERFPNSFGKYIILSAGVDIEINHRYYKQHSEKYNLFPAQIIFLNNWEYIAGIPENISKYDSILDTSPRIKPKKFLCFNNGLRSHRFYLVAQFLDDGFLNKAYISCLFRSFQNNKSEMLQIFYNTQLKYQMPTWANDIYNILKKNVDLFPIELNWLHPEDYNKYCFTIENDLEYYRNSYFSVITETKFFKDLPNLVEGQFNGIFFTEKTFKVILAKHPFILASFTGSLSALKSLGYKTFHPYINEEYDLIEDDEKRITIILEEILRLSNFTDNEWLDWQEAVRPIVEYNFQHAAYRYKNRVTYETYQLRSS